MTLAQLLMAGRLSSLVSFFSVLYLGLFLPVSLLIFGLVPQKARRYVLLALSCLFYWLVSGQLIAYLALATLSAHYFGLWLDHLHARRTEALAAAPKEEKKAIRAAWQRRLNGVTALAVVVHIGVLFALKYSGFFFWNINTLLGAMHLGFRFAIPNYLQPLGISFFTLQALSYILDVCRGTQKADDNLLRLSLFMSFFPQIVEGPICRYRDTAEQLWNVRGIEFENLKYGVQRILYGMLKKMVVADRLNLMVNIVFANPQDYEGGILFLAAIGYTIELYMDFSGSMDAVCGVANILGITMPENFQRPFFSRTISEFWQRWHITLGTWFRDYVFYPVSTSKPMKTLTLKARKRLGNRFGPLAAGGIALLCVWFCNGMWHGAGWHYVAFGLYHFIFIFLGSLVSPWTRQMNEKLRIDAQRPAYRVAQTIRTALVVVFGEIFFRADDLPRAFGMIGRIFTNFTFTALRGDIPSVLGIDGKDFLIVGVTLLIVFAVSLMNERGVDVRKRLAGRHAAVRWAVLYALILYIVVFGAYGVGYVPVDPMYANF